MLLTASSVDSLSACAVSSAIRSFAYEMSNPTNRKRVQKVDKASGATSIPRHDVFIDYLHAPSVSGRPWPSVLHLRYQHDP
jgi:hypothetical protein